MGGGGSFFEIDSWNCKAGVDVVVFVVMTHTKKLVVWILAGTLSVAQAEKPNIILVVADDMGFGDLGIQGAKGIETPNLDAMAKSGLQCSQAYNASSVCAPSRAGLITGRDPRRFGFESNMNPSKWTRDEYNGLPPEEKTLADQFRSAGYHTIAVGKWHLGYQEAQYPTERGFDEFYGFIRGSADYFPKKGKAKNVHYNGEVRNDFKQEYMTDILTYEGIELIKKTPAEKPFFMYLAYNAPHSPMQAKEEDLKHFSHIKDKKRRIYNAMVYAMDRGIGEIRASLKASGKLDNTIIVFISDNGAAPQYGSWSGPLSGSKGTMREGGLRTPFIVSWPTKIKPLVYDGLVTTYDLLPTLMKYADGDLLKRKDKEPLTDGIDLSEQWLGKGEVVRNRVHFARLQGQSTLITEKLKFIRLMHRPAQLFDISADIGEQKDLAGERHEDLLKMFQQLMEIEAKQTEAMHFSSGLIWMKGTANAYEKWGVRDEAM